jgi:hypothetical protein
VTDISPDLIRQWQASRRLAERTAARLAAELRGRQRWEAVPGNFPLAIRMRVSQGTVRRAKNLLADHGVIMKDATTGGTTGYYVTGPPPRHPQDSAIARRARQLAIPAMTSELQQPPVPHPHGARMTPAPARPDPRFRETWVDMIRHVHAEIDPGAPAITYADFGGQPVRVTALSLGILLPADTGHEERLHYLDIDGTTSDGRPSNETYLDGHHWPPELEHLIPVLRAAGTYAPDIP